MSSMFIDEEKDLSEMNYLGEAREKLMWLFPSPEMNKRWCRMYPEYLSGWSKQSYFRSRIVSDQ